MCWVVGRCEVPSDGKEYEETGGGGLLRAGRGFPSRQGLVRDEAVAQDSCIEIERTADTDIETVLVLSMRSVSHHQAEPHGVDDPRPRRNREKRPPTPTLLVPPVDPEVHFRHEAHQIVSFIVDADDTVDDCDGIHPSRAKVMCPSEAEPEAETLKHPWTFSVRVRRILLLVRVGSQGRQRCAVSRGTGRACLRSKSCRRGGVG